MSLVVWFDIPVRDLDRAIDFYSAVLAAELTRQDYPGSSLGFFPHIEGQVGGCLYEGEVGASGRLPV